MYIREFEYIVTVAETGNITKAANQLFVTQSALSKFIQRMETEMGTQLFIRTGRKVTPTFAGAKCVQMAQNVLNMDKQLKYEIQQIINDRIGLIRLGFHGSWANSFYKNIYPEYAKKYPEVELRIREVSSGRTINKLMANNELDIALIGSRWNEHSQYMCETLRVQYSVLAVKDDHPILLKTVNDPQYPHPFIDFEQLRDEAFILRESGTITREYSMEVLRVYGLNPRISLEATSRSNALFAAENGIGITFTQDDPVIKRFYNIVYLSYKGLGREESYQNVIYRKDAPLSMPERDLIDLIKKEYNTP